MTKNDKSLVDEAQLMMHTLGWASIAELEDKAETKTAKKAIHQIAVRAYHNEEAACGLL